MNNEPADVMEGDESSTLEGNSNFGAIKLGLYAIGAYLLVSSVAKIYSVVYVMDVNTPYNLRLREKIEQMYAPAAMHLDVITYVLIIVAVLASIFRHRSAAWMFLLAFFMKVSANLYNLANGPGLDSLTPESILKGLFSWGLLLGTVLLAFSARKHKVLY